MKTPSLLSLTLVSGDVYVSNPRSSNNRLNEDSRARKNSNRLFDSQNNNRGGVNKGEFVQNYYSGQYMEIEYTQQHSCNVGMGLCDTIIQYYCHDSVRDGMVTETIPLSSEKCEAASCDLDNKFGMHENLRYYQQCTKRIRNKNLFVSTQNLKGHTAQYTRQNNNGKRYGYECPEERDYFPYWGPSPWRTIAVLTDYRDCEQLRADSNIGYCNPSIKEVESLEDDEYIPINEAACSDAKMKWETKNDSTFFCGKPIRSRDNHHGNNGELGHSKFIWKIPEDIELDQNCVIRVRYNISTADYNPNTDSKSRKPKDISENLRFSSPESASKRGFELTNDPNVAIFDFMDQVKLELNVQTDQYGRTFQDRSHVFRVLKSPSVKGNVFDLSIGGKRGNAAQVYPSVTYQFQPRDLFLTRSDKINLHWTGSRSNNGGNSGKGDRKHDLHSITTHNGTNCFFLQTKNESLEQSTAPSTSFDDFIEDPSSCLLIGWQHLSNGFPMVSRVQLTENSRINTNKPEKSALKMKIGIEFVSDEYQLEIQELSETSLQILDGEAYKSIKSNLAAKKIDIFLLSPGNTNINAKIRDNEGTFYLWNSISLKINSVYENFRFLIMVLSSTE